MTEKATIIVDGDVGPLRQKLREGAAAELLDGPPRLVVTSGTVTLDGRTVTGQRVLPSAP